MILRKKKINCKDMENELKSYHNKTEWANFVLMQDSWPQLKSDSTSWRKTLKNSHNSKIQWLVVSTLCRETKIHLNQKGWIRGNTKIGPILEVATCCLQGKYAVEIRIESYEQRTILTRGSEFLMAWISWSRTEQQRAPRQRAGNLRDAVRRLCFDIDCTCFCEQIKG